MTRHNVQSIELDVALETAFDYVGDHTRLPEWTKAFAHVDNGSATMRTPDGEVQVALAVHRSRERGTVDWEMRFSDGSVAWAYSRLVPAGEARTVFSFVLLPPVAALESLEGDLEQQAAILTEELRALKRRLEAESDG